jgi:hypothetical protein
LNLEAAGFSDLPPLLFWNDSQVRQIAYCDNARSRAKIKSTQATRRAVIRMTNPTDTIGSSFFDLSSLRCNRDRIRFYRSIVVSA